MDAPTGTDRPLTVMITGATGFVGFHAARTLHAAGHRIRALVRNPEKARRAFEPAGLADTDEVDVIRGDITDARSVAEALEGCDAVLHSAAMVSVHSRDADTVAHINLAGTRNVLGCALDRGIQRLVHVSSTTALFRPEAGRVDEHSPLGNATRGYGASKIVCEKYVRALQARGAPIQITYPGSVIGPDDPGLSEAVAGFKAMLESRVVAITTSGIQLIDVRDLTEAHLRLLERGGPPNRFLLGGHYLTWAGLADVLEETTGQPFVRLPMPALGMRLLGELLELLGRFAKVEVPMTAESSRYATAWAVADDRHVKETLGLTYRDVRESLRDMIEWLQESRLPRSMLGF